MPVSLSTNAICSVLFLPSFCMVICLRKRGWRRKRRSEGLEKNYCSSRPVRRILFLEFELCCNFALCFVIFLVFVFPMQCSCARINSGTPEHFKFNCVDFYLFLYTCTCFINCYVSVILGTLHSAYDL